MGVAQWPVSIAFVQLSLALAHNHDGLILTWEGHGQGGLFVSVQSQKPIIVNPVLGQLRHRITDLENCHDGGVQ